MVGGLFHNMAHNLDFLVGIFFSINVASVLVMLTNKKHFVSAK